MKKLFLTAAAIFCVGISVNAQALFPKGEAQLIEFTNTSAKFEVPKGKTWIIYSMFSDHTVDWLDVRIFLKDLNGVEKTNYAKNIFGPQFYWSAASSAVATFTATPSVPYPIVFPENTSFSLIILKGQFGKIQPHNGKGYISLIEIDN